jgi:hypothetical protein
VRPTSANAHATRHCGCRRRGSAKGANGWRRSAQEGPGAAGVLTHGTDGRRNVASGGVAESGSGGWGRASGSGCKGGGRRLRARVEQGGAGGLGGGSLAATNRSGRREEEEAAVDGRC